MSFSWVSGDPIAPLTLGTGPCHYDSHRDTWWRRLRDGAFMGPVVCGICHPPLAVPDEQVVLVDHQGQPRL